MCRKLCPPLAKIYLQIYFQLIMSTSGYNLLADVPLIMPTSGYNLQTDVQLIMPTSGYNVQTDAQATIYKLTCS